MPLPFLILLGIAIGAAGAAVVGFWDRILNWAQTMFLPWVDKYLPDLADDAHRAFMSVHQAVADVRRAIRDAWSKLRTRLVGQLVEFSRDVNSQWIVRIISWIIPPLGPQEDELEEHEVKRRIPVEDVPPEVLKRWMRRNENTINIDVTKLRDEEVMDIRMEEE